MKVDVVDSSRKSVKKIDLDDAVFGTEVKPHLLHQAVRSQLAAARSGTASTKTRSEIVGTGAKMYRQKGTGRSRAGSVKSNIRIGGGTQFGPKPKSYAFRVNKKERAAALRSALSMKAAEEKLLIVDELNLSEPKTKSFVELMNGLNVEEGLIVTHDADRNLVLGSRNIKSFKVLNVEGLNVYDLLKFKTLIITQNAVEAVQGRCRT